MAVTSVATDTFLADAVLMIRDDLLANITDPGAAQRAGDEKFVMTSYPSRPVDYPIITVRSVGMSTPTRMGINSLLHLAEVPIEVRVWAKNEIQRVQLTQQVINRLRNVEATLTVTGNLLDFQILSVVPVDESIGEVSIKSNVINFGYKFILGA